MKPGVSTNINTRLLGTCPAPVQGSADITSLYTAKFGTPVPGINPSCSSVALP